MRGARATEDSQGQALVRPDRRGGPCRRAHGRVSRARRSPPEARTRDHGGMPPLARSPRPNDGRPALASRLRGMARAAGTAASAVRPPRRARGLGAGGLGRGVALRGTVWPGGDVTEYDGVVLVGPEGRIDQIGPTWAVPIPVGVRVIGAAHTWVGPGVIDAHVHLAFGPVERGAARRGGRRPRPRRAAAGRAARAHGHAGRRPARRTSGWPGRCSPRPAGTRSGRGARAASPDS